MTWKELSPRWKALFLLLAFYSLARFSYSVIRYNPILTPSISGDFLASFQEAQHWKETGQFQLMATTNAPYPPFFYWWLFPLTELPYPVVSALLYLVQFPLFAWGLALLVRTVSPDSRIRPLEYGIAALMAVNFQPLLETLSQHKVEGIEFFLLCALFWAFKQRKDLKSGVLLFLASALKYLPAILILSFLVKRQTRVLKGFLLAGTVCLGAFALFFGLEQAWSLGVRQTLWLALDREADSNLLTANFEWQSLSQVVNRLFTRPDPAHPLAEVLRSSQAVAVSYPEMAAKVGTALKLLILAGFLFWMRRPWNRDKKEEWPLILLELSATLLLLPFLIQAFRMHYGILLLPAFVFTALILLQRWRLAGLAEKLLFGAGFLLVGMSYPRLYQWWSFPFYGYCLFGAALFLFHKKLSHELSQK